MKKIMNEKTIKTAAIGLSAIMAMSTSVTVMAAEGETVGQDKNTTTENSETEQKKDLKNEVEKLQNTASDLTEDISTINTEAGSVKDAEKKEETAVNSANGKNVNQEVKDKAKKLESVTTENKSVEGQSEQIVNRATDSVELAENKLDDAKDEAENIDSAMKEAEDIVDDANKTVTKANNKADSAIKNIEKNTDEIKNAANLADAQNAAKEAQNAADAANKELADAVTKLAKAQTDLNLAKTKAEEAEEAYKKALEEAEGSSSVAVDELKAASDAAKALKEEAQKAVDAAKLNAEDQAALKIIKKQEEIQNMDPNKWWHEDQLFKKIMNDYYIPNVLQKEVGEEATIIFDEDFTRPQNHGENYIKATIKEKDGKETIRYFNYSLDKSGKSMVIFEKKENTRSHKEFDYWGNENYLEYKNGNTQNNCFNDGEDTGFNDYLNNKADEEIKQSIKDKQDILKQAESITGGLYRTADQLFVLIMNQYYIPNVLKTEEETTIELDSDFSRFSPSYKNYMKVFTKDSEGNIIDTKYYNYEIDSNSRNLVIFEKEEVYKEVEEKYYTNEYFENYEKNGSKEGILLVEKDDQGLNDYLKDAREKEAKLIAHQTVVNAAAAAEKQAKDAAEKVEALKDEIEKLKNSKTDTAAELIALQSKLNQAEDNYGNAKEKAFILKVKLEESKEALKQAEIKFTPAPTTEPTGGETSPSSSVTSRTAVTNLPLLADGNNVIQTGAVPLAGGITNVNNAVIANGDNNPVVIDDENTPLAANIKDLSNDTATTIEDSQVPLADAPVGVMSWWWLVVVALLGATGYEMYRRHKLNAECVDLDL